MRSRPAFLKTRIARRVFGLFLLCAVLPTLTLAAATYWMVSREMRAQARRELEQAAKVSGTVLQARLQEADAALLDLARARQHGDSLTPELTRSLYQKFSAVAVGLPASVPVRVIGVAGAAWPSITSEVAAQRLHRSLLLVHPGTPTPAIVLIRTSDSPTDGSILVYGAVAGSHLWGAEGAEPLVPPDTDFCVYSPTLTEPLHCSDAGERQVLAAYAKGNPTVIGGVSQVFLGFDFGAPSWSVQLSRPVAAFSAPLEFRRSVLLTLALGGWLVVLSSNVLLRYRLDPVGQLQDAARRMASGDFSVAVTLSTRDELEDLANAFNGMASQLNAQFTLLRALHEVDREALAAHSETEVARAALMHFPRLLPVDEAMIAIRIPTADQPDAASTWRMRSDGLPVYGNAILPSSALAELQGSAEQHQVIAGSSRSALLEVLDLRMAGAHLLLPLTERGICFGSVLLTSRMGQSFTEADIGRAKQVVDQVALALANSRLVQRLNALSVGTLEALARSIDAVSPWTAGHSERVTGLAMAIGRRLELSDDQLDQLHRGGLLHDVGKIGVSPAILDKPGKLTDAEFETIRAHPVIGARILEPVTAYEDVIPIVRHHHERFDGSGYPDRLAGRAIPYLARVLTVADVYDALVSDRPYRGGWAHQEAVDYIAKRVGMEFDPEIVAAFLQLEAGDLQSALNVELERIGSGGKESGEPRGRLLI